MPEHVVAIQQIVPIPEKMVFSYLSNGTTDNANGDYSSTPDSFKITCDIGSERLHINRMIVSVEDVGGFDSGRYGNNIILTNGISLVIRNADDEMVKDLTNGATVKTNAEWAGFCHDVSLINFGGGNAVMSVRWTFGKAGSPLMLTSGDYLAIELSDDYSGLVRHKFMVQGYYSP